MSATRTTWATVGNTWVRFDRAGRTIRVLIASRHVGSATSMRDAREVAARALSVTA